MFKSLGCLFFALFFSTPICHASRGTRSIPINIFSTHDFTRNSKGVSLPNGPAPNVYGTPQRVGLKTELMVNLVNMSDRPQSGSLAFLSAAGTSARAVCQEAGAYNYLNGYLYLCQPGSPSKSSVGSIIPATTSTVGTNQIPAPVNFTIAAADSTRIILTFVAFGTYGSPPTGCESAYVDFIASVEVRVDNDRGAIAASVTPRVSPITNYIGGGGTLQYCDIGPGFSNTYGGYFEPLPMTPIMINGGRPF